MVLHSTWMFAMGPFWAEPLSSSTITIQDTSGWSPAIRDLSVGYLNNCFGIQRQICPISIHLRIWSEQSIGRSHLPTKELMNHRSWLVNVGILTTGPRVAFYCHYSVFTALLSRIPWRSGFQVKVKEVNAFPGWMAEKKLYPILAPKSSFDKCALEE